MNVEFKFHYVVDGAQKGFLARKAHVTEDELVLDGQRLPFSWVTDSHAGENRIVLALQPTEEPGKELSEMMRDGILVLDVAGIGAADLERRIDRVASRLAAEAHRKALEAEGRGDEARIETCPFCDSTVDLCELPKTKNVYCLPLRFPLRPGQDPRRRREGHPLLRLSRVQFLRRSRNTPSSTSTSSSCVRLRMQTKSLCEGCPPPPPPPLILCIFLISASPDGHLGTHQVLHGARADSRWRLAGANAAAAAGNYREADPIYARIMERHPDHPGILMNQGLAHLLGKDTDTAVPTSRRASRAVPTTCPPSG